MKHNFLTCLAVALGAATLLPAAHSQTPEPRIATRDELRVCMDSADQIQETRKALDAQSRANLEANEALRAEGEQMKEDQKLADGNEIRMNSFNRRVRAYNEKLDAARAKNAALRSDLEALNKTIVAHNERCGRISFKPEDKEAILKEREAAKK